jgi:hypothetical protein
MFELVDRFEGHTTTRVAVAYGVRAFLHVGHTMDQPRFGAIAEDFFGFLAGDFTGHIVFDQVVTEPAKMEANLHRILTIVKFRVEVFAVFAGADRDGVIVMLIQHLDNFLKG